MSKLYFKVASDWQEVVRLRTEISKLEAQIKSMDANKAPQAVAVLNRQMQQTKQQMQGMITEAAKAGAAMDNDFKSKIYQSSQSVNDFTQKIINQKSAIKGFEQDLRALQEEYRKIAKNGGKSQGGLDRIHRMKNIIAEEKDALFNLTQEQANARLSTKKLRDEYSLYKDEGKGLVNTTDSIGISLKKAFAIIGGAAAIKQLGSEIIRVRGEFQSMQTAIETLVGKDMAGNLIPQIKELAKTSPLTLTDMVGAEKMMLGFNIKAEDTIRYLQALGDISMGNSQKFNSLTLAFSQMSASGKLMGQDLNQMINAGFNPLQTISEKTGKSIATLKDEMSKGAISAEMVQQAFIDATSAGGKFFGMSENASKTINGQLSMMQDALDEVFNEIGTKGEDVIMSGIKATTSLIENYETVGKILTGLVATYGTYKAATIAYYAITKTYGIYDIATKELQFAATMKNVVATNAMIIKQKLLNATMLKNPYVLVATLAIGAAAAMWALHDGTTAVEKAQKKFNEEKEEAINREAAHKAHIDSLISTIQDETVAEMNRIGAMDQLKAAYPHIFAKYVDEKGHLRDIIGYKKEIAEFDAKVSVGVAKRQADRAKQELIRVNKEINFRSGKYNGQTRDFHSKTTNELEDIQSERLERYLLLQSEYNRIANLQAKASINPVAAIQNKSYWETQKKDAETAIDSIDSKQRKLLNEGKFDKVDSKVVTNYKEQKRLIAEAEKELKAYPSTSDTTKQEKASDKLKKDQEKRNEELLTLQKNNQKSEVDLMEEGSKKKIAQIELDYKNEIASIKKQEEEWSKAQGGQLTEKQSKEISIAYTQAENKKDKGVSDTSKEQLKVEQQALNDYLKEYGTFQQQKLAIAEEYAEKIKQAQEESGTNSSQIKLLEKQRDVAIQNKETEAIKANIDWVTVFGEFGGMFNGMIKPALEEAKKYVQTDKFKDSDQVSQKALIDAINQMEKSLGGAGGLNFKKLGQDVQIYQNSLRELNTAKEEEISAINKLKKSQEEYDKTVKNGTEQEKLVAKDALDVAQQNADAASKKVKTQTGIANQSQQDVTDTATNLRANMDNVIDGLSKLASGGIKNAYDGLIQAGKGIGGAIEKVSDKLEDVPIIGWIVSIIDVFKDGLSNLVGGLLDSVFNAISGILSDVLSGDFFVTIGKSLASGVGKILNAITFGGFNSWFNVNGNEKETAEKIDKLTNSNEALKTSIDGLTKKMDESNGVKSVDYYQKAKDAQGRSNENYRQILDAQMNYNSAHHSNAYYWDLNKSSLNQVNSLLGINLKNSWTDFSRLTAEQMNEIRAQLPDIWSEMINEGKYGSRFKDDWNNYADQAGKIEELTEKINENIAQISFDSLRDSFIDSLMDMDASAEDFANNFEEYLMRAMLNFSMGDLVDDEMKAWYTDWAETIGDQKGKLTPEQIEQYKREWDEMVQKGIDKRNELAELTGYDPSSSSSSQDSTQKGFASMSQDTGNELNGRFTALQISGEEIKNQNILQSQSLNLLTVEADAILTVNTETRNIADEIRTIQVNSYLELQEIRENTGMSAKSLKAMESKLDKIEGNTRALSSK